jgi:hypothetical protein
MTYLLKSGGTFLDQISQPIVRKALPCSGNVLQPPFFYADRLGGFRGRCVQVKTLFKHPLSNYLKLKIETSIDE